MDFTRQKSGEFFKIIDGGQSKNPLPSPLLCQRRGNYAYPIDDVASPPLEKGDLGGDYNKSG